MDITEHKRAEEALKRSEERYHNLIEFAEVGIIVSEDGKITQVNRRAEEIYGYSKKELIGKSPSILTPLKYRKQHREVLNEIIKLGKAKKEIFEEEGMRKDGTLFPIEISFSLTQAGENTVIAVMRDITERKQAEEEIKKTRDFLESVIENSRDGIITTDAKGHITSANSAMEKMCRFKKEELIGNHASILTIEDKDIRKKILEKAGELFEKGFASYESIQKTKDGRLIDVECNSSLIKDDKGNYIMGVSIIRDITERKKMEQQLLQSEKLRSLGELAEGVAHDFNNVLATILGRAQLLKMKIEPPPRGEERRQVVHELKKGLEVIEKAAREGADTVGRIREFSRIRDDDKYFTAVNLNEVIDNTLEFTRLRWKDEAELKGIKISIQKEFSLLPTTVGNASELREVFTNLINNAIDAMPKGGKITIKTFKEEGHICVKVKDTGNGISGAIRGRIFDPFFTTKGIQFSGLGLSVSYGIINRHRGDISLDSVEGKGTTFTITLPISDKRIRKDEAKPISGKQRKASILVIEDEEDVRRLLSDILIMGGHEVRVVSNGKRGIELFRGKRFDLVFTDLGMPEMSGWQVAKEIKKMDDKTPVALITGWMVQPKRTEMKERGVDLIVNKPFQIDQILRMVQEGMEIKDRLKRIGKQ